MNNPTQRFNSLIQKHYDSDISLLVSHINQVIKSLEHIDDRYLKRDIQYVKLMLQLIEMSGFNSYLTLSFNRHMACVTAFNSLITWAYPMPVEKMPYDRVEQRLKLQKLFSILFESRELPLLQVLWLDVREDCFYISPHLADFLLKFIYFKYSIE